MVFPRSYLYAACEGNCVWEYTAKSAFMRLGGFNIKCI
jgi:hypothetical protein